MGVRITIDIFSGRSNPVLELDGPEAKDALRRLQPAGKPTRPLAPRIRSRLGYRGLLIELTDERVGALPRTFRLFHGSLFGPRLSERATDERFEEYICGRAGPVRRLQLGPGLEDLIRKQIEQARFPRSRPARKRPKPPPNSALPMCAALRTRLVERWWPEAAP